jgi:hypothetical protein
MLPNIVAVLPEKGVGVHLLRLGACIGNIRVPSARLLLVRNDGRGHLLLRRKLGDSRPHAQPGGRITALDEG